MMSTFLGPITFHGDRKKEGDLQGSNHFWGRFPVSLGLSAIRAPGPRKPCIQYRTRMKRQKDGGIDRRSEIFLKKK